MAENESIGGISVEIVGDYSGLQDDINSAAQLAARGGEQIADALSAGADSADTLSSAVAAVSASMGGFGDQIESLAASGAALADGLGQVAQSSDALAGNLASAGEAAVSAAEGGAALAESLDADAQAAIAFSAATEAAINSSDDLAAQVGELVKIGYTTSEAFELITSRAEAMAAAVQSAGEVASTAFEGGAEGAQSFAGATEAAGSAAGQAAAQLSLFDEAIQVPYEDAAGQLNMFATELEPIPAAASSAAEALGGMAAGAESAKSGLQETVPAVEQTTSSLEGMVQSLVAVGAALAFTEKLVEFGHAALEAADAVDDASTAMGLLSGNADQAAVDVGRLRDVANDQALSFPEILQASTRMTAFLGSTQPVPGVLRAVGDSAAVMGSSITAASGSFERIIASGDLSQRSLMRLGLTLNDVAKAMNTTADKAKDAFKELDQSQKIEVMEKALGKFEGAAAKLSNDGLGALVRAGNAFNVVLEELGKALDPVIKSVADFVATQIVPFLQDMVKAFEALPDPVKNTVIGIGLLAAAIVPIAAAIGGVSVAFGALTTALAPVGAALAGLGSAMTGVGASYGLMVGAGVLTVAGWAAVAVAVFELVRAYMALRDAENLLAETQKQGVNLLATYETALRQHGVDISALQKQYQQGQISAQEYRKALDGLRDEYLKGHPVIQAHTAATTAAATAADGARIKMQSLKDAVASSWQAYQTASAKLAEHKATTEDVAKAYDKWMSATNALKSAQQAHLPIVIAIHKATHDFNQESLQIPTSQQAAAQALEAVGIKAAALGQALQVAQSQLAAVEERYRNHNATAAEVATALDRVTAAQHAVNAAIDAANPAIITWAETWKQSHLALDTTEKNIRKLIPAFSAIPAPIRTVTDILADMGVKIDKAHESLEHKLLRDYDELATKTHVLTEENDAWGRVSSTVDKLASTDLPRAIAEYDKHIAQMTALGAKEGEIIAQREHEMEVIIRNKELSGESATAQIIALDNLKQRQQDLIDKTRMWGDLYVSVKNDILHAYNQIGGAVANAIVDGQNLGKALEDLGKQALKSIIGDIVNTALKSLRISLMGTTDDVKTLKKSVEDLSKSLKDAFGGVPSESGGAPIGSTSGGSGGAGMSGGGVLGAAGAIASIGTLISSIIGNVQFSAMNKSLDLIVKHTLEIANEAMNRRKDAWDQHLALSGILNQVGTAITDSANAIITSLTSGLTALIQSSVDIAGTTAIITAVRDVSTTQITATTAVVNILQQGFNATVTAISESTNALGGTLISGFQALISSLGSVRKYSSGGMVPNTGLAMLHAGELVIPAADVPNLPDLPGVPQPGSPSSPSADTYRAAPAAGGGTQTNTFNIYQATDPRETTRQIAQTLKRITPSAAAYST